MSNGPFRTAETKFARAELSTVEADGTFSGYASLFGKADLGRDVVMPGAFRASLAKRGAAGIKMLFQHDPNEPIGVWLDINEDARGLFVKGKLTTEVARAREVLSLMRAGALDGLSIGYRTVRGRTDRKTGLRQLLEIDLWEISVVTFPMLPEARVSAVKSRERERFLAAVRQATELIARATSERAGGVTGKRACACGCRKVDSSVGNTRIASPGLSPATPAVQGDAYELSAARFLDAARRLHRALAAPRLEARYNPNWPLQPRVPKRNLGAGRWTRLGEAESSSEEDASSSETGGDQIQLSLLEGPASWQRCMDRCYALLERHQPPGSDRNETDFRRCMSECLGRAI